jgi:DNA replication protein DnaC
MSSAGVAVRADADLVTGRLREFKLTTAAEEMVPRLTQRDLAAALPVVGEVLDAEAEARHERRVTRLRRTSKLPATKTFGSFDMNRIPAALRQKIATLRDGAFLAEATNILAFGLPGTGKSHALAALGHELVLAGHSVLFVPTYEIVQQLLAAKRDLELPRKLHRLDQFELIILDDIGYVQQSAEEAEVLFTLLAERYERQSIALTSNLVFSDWDRVFKNKMATTAAIDRLVHHSAILEFDVTSYRSATPTTKKAKREAKT